METDFIILSEYCSKSHIESSFIELLAEEGLIDLQTIEGVEYVYTSQLPDLERYIRWHYDLSINIAGIDVIKNLLLRLEELQKEIHRLRKETSQTSFFTE